MPDPPGRGRDAGYQAMHPVHYIEKDWGLEPFTGGLEFRWRFPGNRRPGPSRGDLAAPPDPPCLLGKWPPPPGKFQFSVEIH